MRTALLALIVTASALGISAQQPKTVNTQLHLGSGGSGTVRDGGEISAIQRAALGGISGAGSSANASLCVFVLERIIAGGRWMLQ